MKQAPPDNLAASINQGVLDDEPRLVGIRRRLHAHPEIGFDTVETADLVASELEKLGLSPRRGVGRTGVVADIRGAFPGPCLLLRADMDALPISEQTGLPFASTVPGAMHACGHDLHTATLLGAARSLVGLRELLHGAVRLVFQPAEETAESGALAMIADGAAEGASFAIGFHNRPELAVGRVGYTRGAANASSDDFEVTLHGRSGHASNPPAVLDPIVTAAALIMQLQTAVSRSIDPAHSAVLSIGHIAGGATHNIIPDSCTFQGTVRCRSAATRDAMEAAFRRICHGVAASMGLTCSVAYARATPILMNDDRLVDVAVRAAARQVGAALVDRLDGPFESEDFGHFSEVVPSCQLLFGSSQPGRRDRLHSATYMPDEGCIRVGAATLARAAVDLLSGPGGREPLREPLYEASR